MYAPMLRKRRKKRLTTVPGMVYWSTLNDCDAGWSSQEARQAHNLKVAGSNPAPATNVGPRRYLRGPFSMSYIVYISWADVGNRF